MRRKGFITFAVCLGIAVVLSLVLLGRSFAFQGYSNATSDSWYNTSWHYRIRIDINSSFVNRTAWPVEMQLNFSDMLPGGTFDINSLRLFEYNQTGPVYEVASQFDAADDYNNVTNALGEFVFIMNGTTFAGQKRVYYLYFDSAENGPKQAATYSGNLNYGQDGQIFLANNSKIDLKIDTNRGESTSGIFHAEKHGTGWVILSAAPGDRTAEYIEMYNGTDTISFDLRNTTFISGPVRLTIRQEGPEVLFGDLDTPTYAGRMIKKYYIYSDAGPQSKGSFIKISQEFIANASGTRSSLNAGAPALDLGRTFSGGGFGIDSEDGNVSEPYSWAYAYDGGGSVAGIVSGNNTGNYFASYDYDLGRIGVNLSEVSVSAGSTISNVAYMYFGTGGSFGTSEFLEVKDGISDLLDIKKNLTERWYVDVSPAINASIYNRNEIIFIRANISTGDPYGLATRINATFDMGTPGSSDDLTLELFDDGSNDDSVAGDDVFSNNYTFLVNASTGAWKINFTAYDNSSLYLGTGIFSFNVTDVYNMSLAIDNPIGITNRQITANITLMNFNSSIAISGALINCSSNGTEVVNKTGLGSGHYAVNFTAPSAVGLFTLDCIAYESNNTGNASAEYFTEPPTTNATMSAVPGNFTLGSVTLNNGASFNFSSNVTNIGNATAHYANMTLDLLSGWSSNSSLELCNNIAINLSCIRQFSISVPPATVPGVYRINSTATWTNPDMTVNFTKAEINVTVLPKQVLQIYEDNASGTGADGADVYIANFTVMSLGNENLSNLTASCLSGTACQDFNISFSSMASVPPGSNITVSFFADIPLSYAPGNFSGIVGVSAQNTSDNVTIAIHIDNTADILVVGDISNVTLYNISALAGSNFSVFANITNTGNSSARNVSLNFSLPVNWSVNSSVEVCGSLVRNASCTRSMLVAAPSLTPPGNYNATMLAHWKNPDNTSGLKNYTIAVAVTSNPVLFVANQSLSGTVGDGQNSNAVNLTVSSTGNFKIIYVDLSCISGTVCSNFTMYASGGVDIAAGMNYTFPINFSVPQKYQAGTYNGTIEVVSDNGGSSLVNVSIAVPSNRHWNMTPLSCTRSTFMAEGKACDINVSNTGNDFINFTITNIIDNKTYTGISNFSILRGQSYVFPVYYNVTGYPPDFYYSLFSVSAVQPAVPENESFNITLIPYAPPLISLEVSPASAQQNNQIMISANITDQTNSGIAFVIVNVTLPNGTVYSSSMNLLNQTGNFSHWQFIFANQSNASTGSTSRRGVYNVTVFSSDALGSVGNETANFSVHLQVVVSARTLSQEYYQGDSGTLYYSVRDGANMGIENVTASFEVRNPNGTLIYSTTKVTDRYGTFEPLPVFYLSSDSVLGNYNLSVISVYTDNETGATFDIAENHTFTVKLKTVTVAGIFADIETAVVWFPNNTMRLNMLVYDSQGASTDPDAMNLTLYDPVQNVYFNINMGSMTKKGKGFYSYSYQMNPYTPTGMYLAVLNLTQGSLSTMSIKAFRVAAGGPYDVRLILATNEVEQGRPLDFMISIENKGEVRQDVYVAYYVIGASDNIIYYKSNEAVLTPEFATQSFSRSAFIFSDQPLGTYMLVAKVKYDNVQPEIIASSTFSVIARRRTPPEPTPPPRPPEPSPEIHEVLNPQIPESVRSLIIEKYSSVTKLYPGFSSIEYVVVRNIGSVTLNNIALSELGIPTSWFNITPAVYRQLPPQNSTVFVIQYHIPEETQLGDYMASILVSSDAATDQKSIKLTIVQSIYELIRDEINQLKSGLQALLIDIGSAKKEGKDVSGVMLFVDQISASIGKAEANLSLNNTDMSLSNVRDAKVMLEQARSLLQKLRVVELEKPAMALISWSLIALVIIAVFVIAIFILRKKKKLQRRPRQLDHIFGLIQKIKGRPPDTGLLSIEKQKIARMLAVLENERKEGIVSDNAYNEMRKNLEAKIASLESKIAKSANKKK
jgi:uncharacterized membrane protein